MKGKFRVTEVTEVRATYIIEASDATTATNKARTIKGHDIQRSIEQHFITKRIEEDSHESIRQTPNTQAEGNHASEQSESN